MANEVITLENLTEFKNKCDETYANIESMGDYIMNVGDNKISALSLVSSEPSTKVPGVLYMLFE